MSPWLEDVGNLNVQSLGGSCGPMMGNSSELCALRSEAELEMYSVEELLEPEPLEWDSRQTSLESL